MPSELDKFLCFSSINLSEPKLVGKSVRADVTLNKITGEEKKFSMLVRYENNVDEKHLPLLRMAFCMPLLNYGLFSKKLLLDFPVSKSDLSLLNDLNVVFSGDILVNKILRRRADFILPEFIPDKKKIKPEDAKPRACIEPKEVVNDFPVAKGIMNQNSCGILSSGGKESLLTYALLNELGVEVHPLYVNESGGHWRTAIPAYNYHRRINPNTCRVWVNVDRLYTFMLDNLKFIRKDHRLVKADTYPIRLCIFPFYIFILLPVFVERRIGNLLMGNEFDDLRQKPVYLGITHYYGIYDQEQIFDIRMHQWYNKRIPGMNQWSILRGLSGLVEERILTRRYPDLAKYQRSCHSCHIENGEIVPCGKCSKCLGILLFLIANKADPKVMGYKDEDIKAFPDRIEPSDLRLDEDEKNQSFYLLNDKKRYPDIKYIDHVEKIHIDPETCDISLIPAQFRDGLMRIIEQYTTGYCKFHGEKWINIEKTEVES
ncbi:MAG: hypothetical protein QHH19_00510, partial [Candidatus Thermoplasmatota archaeon]|nr:hypothetical protein [Candidatus Thermoplasmatota archaeon]